MTSFGNERMEEFQSNERAGGVGSAAGKFWLQSPYYASRFTYFHRPSVWNRMSESGRFEWHGLTGFKTLFAGQSGIRYKGEARGRAARGTQWMLNAGGRGLEGVGGIIRNFAQYTTVTETFGRPKVNRIGVGFQRAGKRFRTGGIGGIVGGFSETGGKYVTGIFGGEIISNKMPYGNLIKAGFNEEEANIILKKAGKAGVMGTFRAGKYVPSIAAETTGIQLRSGTAAGSKAISSAVRFAGATKLMAGLSVGLNVALFGGMLANLTYSGMRTLGETANRLRTDMRIQNLEFGSGFAPFTSAGAYTERQRAVQAIQSSHLNARSSIGNEAGLMHDMSY